mmetsp:Transcript_88841/g.235971  ORF Transcript_88841/g.235971 Transcript_88841/m.235971 type:complete len:82 (+) Transcript_88841:229-474(+)
MMSIHLQQRSWNACTGNAERRPNERIRASDHGSAAVMANMKNPEMVRKAKEHAISRIRLLALHAGMDVMASTDTPQKGEES